MLVIFLMILRSYFTPDGHITDELPLRKEIYEDLKNYAGSNLPRKISNILEILKLEAQKEDFLPKQDRIHVTNGTLKLDGTFIESKSEVVWNRLPVSYDSNGTYSSLCG